ncbi:MAG TPA: tyrosine-type recombinase/integrase, partial [Pseudonocardiaceae bacterium]
LIRKILTGCDGRDLISRRDTAIIRLLWDTGCRLSEIANLDVDDIDLDVDVIHVVGKGRRPRSVPFSPKTGQALARYLRVRASDKWASHKQGRPCQPCAGRATADHARSGGGRMDADREREIDRAPRHPALDLWMRWFATMAFAGVLAYASYQHQRDFALAGGADLTTARLWPFSVDGLLVLSAAGLPRDARRTSRRSRISLWAAFSAEIIVSLAVNIATAPSMNWAPILVVDRPPAALLLAVELSGRRRHQDSADDEREPDRDKESRPEMLTENRTETESRVRGWRAGREGGQVSAHRRRGDVGALPEQGSRGGARADRRGAGLGGAYEQLWAGGAAEVAA